MSYLCNQHICCKSISFCFRSKLIYDRTKTILISDRRNLRTITCNKIVKCDRSSSTLNLKCIILTAIYPSLIGIINDSLECGISVVSLTTLVSFGYISIVNGNHIQTSIIYGNIKITSDILSTRILGIFSSNPLRKLIKITTCTINVSFNLFCVNKSCVCFHLFISPCQSTFYSYIITKFFLIVKLIIFTSFSKRILNRIFTSLFNISIIYQFSHRTSNRTT